MTIEDIREAKERFQRLKAKHALDARIAQEVLDIPVFPPPPDFPGIAWTCIMSGCGLSHVPRYSESISAAFEVVEHLRAQGLDVEVTGYGDGEPHWRAEVRCGDTRHDWFEADAATAPMAICTAALAWKEERDASAGSESD